MRGTWPCTSRCWRVSWPIRPIPTTCRAACRADSSSVTPELAYDSSRGVHGDVGFDCPSFARDHEKSFSIPCRAARIPGLRPHRRSRGARRPARRSVLHHHAARGAPGHAGLPFGHGVGRPAPAVEDDDAEGTHVPAHLRHLRALRRQGRRAAAHGGRQAGSGTRLQPAHRGAPGRAGQERGALRGALLPGAPARRQRDRAPDLEWRAPGIAAIRLPSASRLGWPHHRGTGIIPRLPSHVSTSAGHRVMGNLVGRNPNACPPSANRCSSAGTPAFFRAP
ncbi:hypothetical protein COLO4_01680 [Corchorus olitorius]|uniref:Uncharacterized protein n=1 Tax=Corchorus olitorius TaxID=93759 RepID=A0A1R3L272_9ROSI|nr:hypothetical protein COLO4_01680 [Corchorus olitorius]